MLACSTSCMAVSSSVSKWDHKGYHAYLRHGRIARVSAEILSADCEERYDRVMTAWPLYRLYGEDLKTWMAGIEICIRRGFTCVDAEDALNDLGDAAFLRPLNVKTMLCAKLDDPKKELRSLIRRLKELEDGDNA